jgi:hypothetical protein
MRPYGTGPEFQPQELKKKKKIEGVIAGYM